MNTRACRIAMLVAVAAAVAAMGCGGDSDASTSDFQKQREQIVAQQRNITPPKAEPAAAGDPAGAETATAPGAVPAGTDAALEIPEPQLIAYRYDPLGKRDPFRSFVLDRLKEVDISTKGPLEQFELGQLEILGVVWETSNRRALVADPSGQAYIVREGDGIGKNDGMILSIDDNLMLVKETYVDFVGDKTTKEIEMRVRQGQGG